MSSTIFNVDRVKDFSVRDDSIYADGSGSEAAVEIAKLGKGLKLTHLDFFVI